MFYLSVFNDGKVFKRNKPSIFLESLDLSPSSLTNSLMPPISESLTLSWSSWIEQHTPQSFAHFREACISFHLRTCCYRVISQHAWPVKRIPHPV